MRKKRKKIGEILVKYPKILIDGNIFPNFISRSMYIEYIVDKLTIYPDILNLSYTMTVHPQFSFMRNALRIMPLFKFLTCENLNIDENLM